MNNSFLMTGVSPPTGPDRRTSPFLAEGVIN
jgi:hypothetical protein